MFLKLPEKFTTNQSESFSTDVIKVGNKAVVVPEIQMNTMINHLSPFTKTVILKDMKQEISLKFPWIVSGYQRQDN